MYFIMQGLLRICREEGWAKCESGLSMVYHQPRSTQLPGLHIYGIVQLARSRFGNSAITRASACRNKSPNRHIYNNGNRKKDNVINNLTSYNLRYNIHMIKIHILYILILRLLLENFKLKYKIESYIIQMVWNEGWTATKYHVHLLPLPVSFPSRRQ